MAGEFRIVYGEHYWPENNIRLSVSPFIRMGSLGELPIATAMRKGMVHKKDRMGNYSTTASGLRVLITANIPGVNIVPINLIVSFVDVGVSAYAPLYPEEIADIAKESGFFLAAPNVSIATSIDDAKKIYSEKLLSTLETITEQSLSSSKSLWQVVTDNSRTHKRSRF